MKPSGMTTFARMLLAAHAEAERIEISQDEFLRKGDIKVPMVSEARRRDDFAGIVRLIQAIESDAELKERATARMRAMRAAEAKAGTVMTDGDEAEDA